MSDPFDALLADTTPIAPSARFTQQLRQQLTTAFDELDRHQEGTMTDTITPTAAATAGTAGTAGTASTVTSVTPYLVVDGAAAAIDFYVQAFGAVEHHRLVGDDGRVGHAEISIGTSRIMLADEHPEYDAIAPTTRGGTSTSFTIETDDVDVRFARALELGATALQPIEDQFYGARRGTLRDPFGHSWSLSQPIPGFDPEQYAQNSAAEGYRIVEPTPTSTEDAPPAAHQVKPLRAGDLYYFTLSVQDLARAQRFYGAVLGWQFGSPDNGHVTNISAPPGGPNVSGDPGARLWFVVDDIQEAVERVRAAGGTAQEPVLYDSGWSADCVDDQGTAFSLSVPSDAYRA